VRGVADDLAGRAAALALGFGADAGTAGRLAGIATREPEAAASTLECSQRSVTKLTFLHISSACHMSETPLHNAAISLRFYHAGSMCKHAAAKLHL